VVPTLPLHRQRLASRARNGGRARQTLSFARESKVLTRESVTPPSGVYGTPIVVKTTCNFVNPVWRRGRQRLLRHAHTRCLLLHPRPRIRGHHHRRLPFLLHRWSTNCYGGRRASSTSSSITSRSPWLGFSGHC
jgi:hypothetical protein